MDIFSKKMLINPSIYKQNEVLINLTENITQDLEIKQNGVYLVEMVGSGGGAARASSTNSSSTKGAVSLAGGGAGGCYVGEIYLEKNTYECKCGNKGTSASASSSDGSQKSTSATAAHDTYIKIKNENSNLIIAGGGKGGYAFAAYTNNTYYATGGKGGTVTVNITPINTLINQSGGNGNGDAKRSTTSVPTVKIEQALSYYTDTTIGKGAAWGINIATIGLLKITYLRRS